MNLYETPKLLSEYLLFHYGAGHEILPWGFGPKEALGFPVRSVTRLLDEGRMRGLSSAQALDLGCAVGRSCYELARHCESVLGIDYSEGFVTAAETVRDQGRLNYWRVDEGDQRSELAAECPAPDLRERIRFEAGDAMHLREDLGEFEVVHAANLLCRLREPQRLLERLPSLVKMGGQLLLTTPCTWLEEFTPPVNWPQGSTFGWLQERLSPHFVLDHQEDLPFLIREHARKFQWSVAMGTRWIRKK